MKRIFLMGYMGAGKTTVGKKLSKQLNLSFIDLDYYIEGRYHKEIRQLFAEKGEEAFRDIERRMLHEVASFEDVLISTGGGTPCFFDNMDFMNEAGTTVYLKVSVDELANRLEVVDGKLTGKLAANIVTKESKLIQLLDWAVECGVDMAHTVAIGDGANDIPMIQAAGTGIAFCAKPKTREAAPFAIDERNLMLAMDIILRD